MCYPSGAYWECAYNFASRRLLVRAVATATEVAAREQQRANIGGGLAEGGGRGGGITKVCVCSPTGHPGSFRCRHHHGEYQWVNRTVPRPS
ncbi:hypothetical protein CDL12_21010 [Handroanthus impetiginosus]|uniref:Uncharacterized protein n=1 Tax=Handroanthus impetiginosus TaxID=429701 RepID=A0A2G9GMB1_9LAMI|nr:hypothetical protein CDL12_21010 [Handroanthus impetiginosus]